jgi:acetyltransferase-like isoleucine patch superfamily enzyme
MIETLKKAYWILRRRPLQLAGTIRQYWLFWRTHKLTPVFFPQTGPVRLGSNVRLQRLRCLSAERPHALITVGDDSVIYENAKIEAYATGKIEIGAGSIIGDARIYARKSIKIGARVVTSWNVFIQDFDPHPIDPELRKIQMEQMCESFRPTYRASRPLPKLDWEFPTTEVVIGDDVWLGANTTVLKGAIIGSGCIIATGAVVTAGTYPPRSILAGQPAKVIKTV